MNPAHRTALLAIAALTLVLSGRSMADNEPPALRRTTLGVKAGPTFTRFYTSPETLESDSGFEMGGTVGAHLLLQLDERFSLRPELGLTRKRGSLAMVTGPIGELHGEHDLTYVDIGVLFRMDAYVPSKSQRLYLIGGGSVAQLLAATVDSGPLGEDVKARIEPYQFDLLGGVGVEFASGSGKIELELRYVHGLLNISSFQDPDRTVTIHTRGAAFTFGYVFGRRDD